MTGAPFRELLFKIVSFARQYFYIEQKQGLKKAGFAIAWLLLVTALLCMPGSAFPKTDWQNKVWLDKWIHLFLFLALVILWCRAYLKRTTVANRKKTFVLLTIISILYGTAMEIVQHYFIPFRSFDYGDILADATGALAGYFISVKRFMQRGSS